MREKKRKKNTKKDLRKLLIKNAVISFCLIIGLLFIGGFANFTLAISNKVFAPGVSVDGINVSGMTYKKAEEMLTVTAQRLYARAKLNLIYKGIKSEISAGQLGIKLNFDGELTEAFNYDKSESDSKIQKYDKTKALYKGANFGTGFVARDKLFVTINAFVETNCFPAKEAAATVDKQNYSIAFTKESTGEVIDANGLTDIVLQKINNEDFSDLVVTSYTAYPQITQDYLEKNTVLIGACETKATGNTNRNNNIRLLCETINGVCINPGDTFSVNELIGERTVEKGFKPAPAIVDGNSLKDQVGGGICQVAGTLYNAALLANMEIVERVKHSWPSSYLPIGLDATLNWNNKDLKIKNTSDMPIYIIASFEKQRVKIQLYGKPLSDGVSIELRNDVTAVIPYNTDIQYTHDLSPGVTKVISSPRQGYEVMVYRVYLQNGVVVKTELISKDRYAPVDKVLLVGSSTNKD